MFGADMAMIQVSGFLSRITQDSLAFLRKGNVVPHVRTVNGDLPRNSLPEFFKRYGWSKTGKEGTCFANQAHQQMFSLDRRTAGLACCVAYCTTLRAG